MSAHKRYRVSVKYTQGDHAGRYVVQVCDATYQEACELYQDWKALGFDVLVIPRGVRRIDMKHLRKYRPIIKKEKK